MYSGNWFRFDGKKYAKVEDKTFVRGDLYRFLKGKNAKVIGSKGEVSVKPYEADAHRVSDILDTLTTVCPVYEDAPCWLDGDDHPRTENIVSFDNGLLLLPDLDLDPSSPQFFSMTAMPYSWSKSSRCDRWLQFLEEVFPNDPQEAALLQEWFGYNLVADTSEEKLMFFVGRPGAGKGTVLEALRAMLGPGQVASTSFDSLVGDFGLQPLLGKLAAIMPDAHITKRGDPAKALQVLKEISGRDSVSINRKNKDFLSDHKLSCRFTISVNSMPDLPDHERSLDRRLLLLHFGESFAGREDTGLKDTIREEAAGIAVWAVQGLLRLREHGWTAPESARPVIEEFRKQSSPISEFAGEFCVTDKSAMVPSLMVYDAYLHWCKDQGAFAGSQCRFSQRFLLLHPGVRPDRIPWQGKQVRGFLGVKLTQEAVERYLIGRR
jgi:P4 family phage/plasmid primase-like protien